MRISQDMALSGSGNENTNNNRLIPTTLRPESPPGGEDTLTDVEDLDEARSSLIQSPTSPPATNSNNASITNALTLPDARRNSDDGGVTDTELLSENDDEPAPMEEEVKYPGASEEMDNILRNYGNEGELCIQDNSGDRVTVSRQTVTSFSGGLSAGNIDQADEEEALTDVEEVEGDGDFEIDIIDTDAPGFSATAHGCFIELIPEMDLGQNEVTITEKDPDSEITVKSERKYSLIEILQCEDAFTEMESLASSPRRLSVDLTSSNQRRLPTPEFAVDPMTDEESIEDGPPDSQNKKTSGLMPRAARSITPSDCGDERLYENITDEEEEDEEAKKKTVSFGKGLAVDEVDQGALTDCEDMQDSGDDADGGDEWIPVRAGSSSDLDKIFQANVAAAQTKISMKDQEPEEPYPETPTDDEEIHCKLIDSRTLTPRLVIYNHKDQLAIESEDEGMGGGMTDVEDFSTVDGDDESVAYNPVTTDADAKVLQEILDSHSSSVSVQESEIMENGESSRGKRDLRRNSKGPDTETEELMDAGEKRNSITSIPTIVIPEGSEANASGGNLIRRRGKKKHAKRSIFF